MKSKELHAEFRTAGVEKSERFGSLGGRLGGCGGGVGSVVVLVVLVLGGDCKADEPLCRR